MKWHKSQNNEEVLTEEIEDLLTLQTNVGVFLPDINELTQDGVQSPLQGSVVEGAGPSLLQIRQLNQHTS